MKTVIRKADPASLRHAAELLHAGEVVAIPTETVYGLAALGLNPDAVKKVFIAKGRPSTDPLILHLPSPDLQQAIHSGIIANHTPREAFALASEFWPGPLTLVLPRGPQVPPEVTSGLDTVAVRYPAHPVAQQLLTLLGCPLAAPSANRFGRISPTDAASVMEELDGRVPLILDGGECSTGVESTVLSLIPPEPIILRPGKITPEDIARVLGRPPHHRKQSAAPNQPMASPGMLESHYAPLTPLYLTQEPITHLQNDLLFIHYRSPGGNLLPNQFVLSDQGDSKTAAKNLYRILRQADAAHGKAILIDPIPDSLLAPALRDRIQRASAGNAKWEGDAWVLRRKHQS